MGTLIEALIRVLKFTEKAFAMNDKGKKKFKTDISVIHYRARLVISFRRKSIFQLFLLPCNLLMHNECSFFHVEVLAEI